MIIQIEVVGACAIVTSCVSLCWLIMRLSLRPLEDRMNRQSEILRQVKGAEDLSNLIDKHVNDHANSCPKGERVDVRPAISAGGVVAALSIVVLLAMLCGCASYTVDRATGTGSSYGFLRSMSVTETRAYGPDGKLVSETVIIDTKSTTGDVLMGLNEIGGTLVNAAEKVKP